MNQKKDTSDNNNEAASTGSMMNPLSIEQNQSVTEEKEGKEGTSIISSLLSELKKDKRHNLKT